MRDNKIIAAAILLLSAVFFGVFILMSRMPINQCLFYMQEIYRFWSWGFLISNIHVFFLLIILLLSSAGIGCKFLKLFKINPDNPLIEFIFSTGLGLGFFSLTTLGLGFLHLFSPFVFYPLLLCLFLCSYQEIKYFLLSLFTAAGETRLTPSVIVYSGCLLAILFLGIILAIGGPPILFDSLVYHLAIPDIYIRNHGIVHIPHLVFANYPLNTEMLFALSMILGGDTVAQLIHPLFGILAGLSIYAMTRDYVVAEASSLQAEGIHTMISTRGGLFAALIFFSMPSVIFTMTFAFNDLALTYYVILAVYAMIHWIKIQNIRWLILSGIFAGLAMGTKYSGIICFGILLGSIMIVGAGPCACPGDGRGKHTGSLLRRLPLKELFLFSLAAGLPVLPWLIKNLIFVGNPVYPFLYCVFGGANWGEFDVQRFTWEMNHYGPTPSGIWRYLSLPMFITCDWKTGDIPVGPIILLYLPFLFFMKNIDKTVKYLLIFCSLYLLFWINTSMVIRFLFPCVALLCPVVGYVVEREGTKGAGGRSQGEETETVSGHTAYSFFAFELPILIALILNIFTLYAAIGQHADFYLGNKTREEKLLSAMPVKNYYQAIRFINESLAQENKILFIGEPRRYYCKKEVLTSSELDTEVISKLVRESKDINRLIQRLKERKITHILYNKHGLAWLNKQFNCLHWENEAQRSRFESFINSLPVIYARDNVYIFRIDFCHEEHK
ncbi:glycosyltransferase family 39 protein [Candidatus Desantisbacteria bacterium]|nr:glycosyltransferase family 39 protein [Candidatus Desantisbacteria bacterium]